MTKGKTAEQLKNSPLFREFGSFNRPNLYIRRNKLACFISSLFAILAVSLSALLIGWIMMLIGYLTGQDFKFQNFSTSGQPPFFEGFGAAILFSLINFYVFFITIPVTWFILSQMTGRLAHRAITDKWVYFRMTMFCGMIVTVGFCSLPILISFTYTVDQIVSGLGCLLGGTIIGAIAGLLTGMIFYVIVRPDSQLSILSTQTADVFD